jgi:asparagine synthase (glutamine-hydrolysing)
MCRIAGIISRKYPLPQLQSDVQHMCNVLAHGGPDDEGFYSNEAHHLVFGHRRLSIVDLTAGGHQPMLKNDGQLALAFNGEIYNYPQLKSTLEKLGYHFNTHCDTEVILAVYQTWGTAGFARLEGMFAFALFDQEKGKTYLCRDQHGIKPLYYSTQNEQLIFASEVKAFKCVSESFAPNSDWKTLFLAFGHMPEPFTTLANVSILPKGNYLEWNHQQQNFEIYPLATEVVGATITSPEQATLAVKEKLTQAVKSHLLADAPIGVFLSGGIDSSVLSLITNDLIGDQLRTVSINFDDPQFSEAKYQDLVTAKLQGQHQSYLIDEQEFLTHFDTALKAMDQPSQDGINSWFVNKCAKENGLKAVLSGIGADEYFGGYPSFKRIKLAKALQRLPKSLLRLLGKLPHEKLKRFYYLSYPSPVGLYLFLRGAFDPIAVARLLNIPLHTVDEILQKVQLPITNFKQLADGKQASALESHFFMQNQLLKDTDCMSMAHGVEVRVPFLDQQLLATLHQIPADVLFAAKQPKALLINSFKHILPQAIWDRPKMGFTFPFEQWLLKVDGLTNPATYCHNENMVNQIEEFKQGKLHWSKALILYQLFNTN